MLTEKKPREPALPLLIPPVILQPARPGLTESFYFFRVQLAYIFPEFTFHLYIYIFTMSTKEEATASHNGRAVGCKLLPTSPGLAEKNVKRFGVKNTVQRVQPAHWLGILHRRGRKCSCFSIPQGRVYKQGWGNRLLS